MLVGQHQKNNDTKYIQTISFTPVENTSSIQITDNNKDTSFYYYVKIKFEKQSSLQNIEIYAKDTLDKKGILVDNFTIGYKSSISTTYYRDIIVNSNLISNSLETFYLTIKEVEGNVVKGTVVQGVSIVNILPVPTASSIGIWGSPSQVACVNGVKIQLGKTGIYELNNPNIKINFVGFIPIENKNFVLDYAYEQLR